MNPGRTFRCVSDRCRQRGRDRHRQVERASRTNNQCSTLHSRLLHSWRLIHSDGLQSMTSIKQIGNRRCDFVRRRGQFRVISSSPTCCLIASIAVDSAAPASSFPLRLLRQSLLMGYNCFLGRRSIRVLAIPFTGKSDNAQSDRTRHGTDL